MLIIMTHGNFAEGILHSAEMIVGELKRTYAVGVQAEMSPEMVIDRIQKITADLEEGETLYVMVDIMSGTPCNVAVRLIREYENYTVISGLNLATLLEFAMSEGIVEEAERIPAALEEGRRQLVDVTAAFREQMKNNRPGN